MDRTAASALCARMRCMSLHALAQFTDHTAAADALRAWLRRHRRIFVLGGAGCSTGSGIGDYRDRDGAWKRTPPITFQAFTGDCALYRRYWARSSIGWPRFVQARPNQVHRVLASLEHSGQIDMLVTQNVDGLHQRAGSTRVIDLHGRLDGVVCLGCAGRWPRAVVQAWIDARNQGWQARLAGYAPDGDADIADDAVASFIAPKCPHCDGLLKPDVVFFGENVPRQRLHDALTALDAADAMLAVGTSLMVYSGFRFARIAAHSGKPLAILNRGRTRADDLAELKLDAEIAETLLAAYRP